MILITVWNINCCYNYFSCNRFKYCCSLCSFRGIYRTNEAVEDQETWKENIYMEPKRVSCSVSASSTRISESVSVKIKRKKETDCVFRFSIRHGFQNPFWGCRAWGWFWGYRAWRRFWDVGVCCEKDTVTQLLYFTMDKHKNKFDFGDTWEIVIGIGRIPFWDTRSRPIHWTSLSMTVMFRNILIFFNINTINVLIFSLTGVKVKSK